MNESLPYWDGASCVSCSAGTDSLNPYFNSGSKTCVTKCPLTYDENNVCRTCAELDKSMPFWSGSECTAACLDDQFVSVDDTKCVDSCDNGRILVDSYGILHERCMKTPFCSNEGVDYTTSENKYVCVSGSTCKNVYKGYPYYALRKCISVPPKDEK